jgi:hypothetical protein
MYRALLFTVFILLTAFLSAQPTIKILESGKRVSIRGLSVVTDDIIWASGSAGSVAKSTDGGNTWTWMTVPGYEKRDFRDIEAFDASTAIIMGVAEPAVILKTTDGGKNWKKVFDDTTKGMFLDAMLFNDDQLGRVIGDPINNSIFLSYTTNQGETWQKTNNPDLLNLLVAREGEAFFAASGTNMAAAGNHFLLVSGGKSSRLLVINRWYDLPLNKGLESTGANSIAVYDRMAVIVGGDFAKDTMRSGNCLLFQLDLKIKFRQPTTPPHGYRSCVIYINRKKLLTCGTSGVDISKDGGMNWELISRESFHVCQKAKKGKAVFLAGGGGRIAKLEY